MYRITQGSNQEETAKLNDDRKKFCEQFEKCMKFGSREDTTIRAKIAESSRPNTSKSSDEQTNRRSTSTA